MDYLQLLPPNVHEDIAKRVYPEQPYDLEIYYDNLKFYKKTDIDENVKKYLIDNANNYNNEYISTISIKIDQCSIDKIFIGVNLRKKRNSRGEYMWGYSLGAERMETNKICFFNENHEFYIKRMEQHYYDKHKSSKLTKIYLTNKANETLSKYFKDKLKCNMCNNFYNKDREIPEANKVKCSCYFSIYNRKQNHHYSFCHKSCLKLFECSRCNRIFINKCIKNNKKNCKVCKSQHCKRCCCQKQCFTCKKDLCFKNKESYIFEEKGRIYECLECLEYNEVENKITYFSLIDLN